MPSPSLFTYTVIVSQCAIEQYGHVNNAIYVQWIQDAAARQPESIPRFDQPENKGWIVRRHRIEYFFDPCPGDEFEVRTWVADLSRTEALRTYEISRTVDGKVIAKGQTEWLYVDIITNRPIPIHSEIQKTFSVLRE